jgi:hypothetical protein
MWLKEQATEGVEISERKWIWGITYSDLEEGLFEWFCCANASSIPIQGPTIQENKGISLKIGIEFKCSNGWLQRFEQRYKVTHKMFDAL